MRRESLLSHKMESIRLESESRVKAKDSKETRGAIMLSLVKYFIKCVVWAIKRKTSLYLTQPTS